MKLMEFFSPEPLMEMRPDSDEFDRLDHADQWLAKYTYENLDKWPGKDILEILAKRYPVEKPTAVYRGINFSTKEHYDEFKEKVADGTYKTGGVSSWSPNPDVEQFAVTRPSYYLDLDTMRGYSEAQKQREYIQGYRGVILKTIAEPGRAINTNASRLGHESEITLFPGEHPVEIVRELKLYRDALEDGDTDIDAVINNTPEEYDRNNAYQHGFYEYVLHHHGDKLSPETKSQVFKRMFKGPEVEFHIREKFFASDYYPRIQISYNGAAIIGATKGFFNPEDYQKVKRAAREMARKITTIIRQHPDHIIEAHLGALIDFSQDKNLKKAVMSHIATQYKELEVDGRNINDLRGKEAQQALHVHTKKLEIVLSQTTNIR